MSIKKDININLSKLLFILAFFIYMLHGVTDITCFRLDVNRQNIYYLCSILLIFSSAVQRKYNKKVFPLILGLLLFLFFLYFNNKLFYLFLFGYFVFASNRVDIKVLVKISLILHLVVMCICLVGSNFGFLENRVWYDSGRIRYSLGYLSFNYPSKVWFFIVLYYTYLNKDKINILEIVIIELINIFFSFITNSRTSLFLVTLYLLSVYVFQRKKQKLKEIKWINQVPVIIIIFSILPLIMGILYLKNPSDYEILDKIFTNRLRLSAEAIYTYGIKLFGQQIKWVGISWNKDANTVYNYVDSSYLQIMINNGLIFFIFLLRGILLLIKYSVEHDDKVLFLCILFVATRSIVEPQLIDIRFNVFILLMGKSLYWCYFKNKKYI